MMMMTLMTEKLTWKLELNEIINDLERWLEIMHNVK
jgi:hypothetical protein